MRAAQQFWQRLLTLIFLVRRVDTTVCSPFLAYTAPDLTPVNLGPDNIYLADCQVTRPARHASDSGKAERLWKLTEELVGTKYLSESKL